MTTEIDNPITIEHAPDLGANKYRANCGVCSRTFIVNFPSGILMVCPGCGAIKSPEWDKAKTSEERK